MKRGAYAEALKERGVLAKDTHGTVIRFAPPLVIYQDEIDFVVDQFAAVLDLGHSRQEVANVMQPAD